MKQFFLCIGIIYATSALAAPQITITPQSVSYGERVQLILSDDKPIQNVPDLSILQNDFMIRGQQQMESTSVINGVKTETHQLILSLFPKKKGILTVGPFNWNGTHLPAQTVSISEQSLSVPSTSASSMTTQNKSTATGQDSTVQNRIFDAQGTIKPDQIYEGESTLYTIRLMENVGLTQAQIQTPNTTKYTLSPFGQDKINQTKVNNTPVRVYERTFLLTPSETGNFDVTGSVLGFIPDTSTVRSRTLGAFPDFFGNDDFFNQPFGIPQKEVYVSTNTSILTVKPKPADWSGWWLPSRQVILKEQFNKPDSIQVGQPIERHVQLTALGVDGNKLPLITQPVNQSIRAYANPDKRTVIDSESGPVGIEEITFVIVPITDGEITIPAIQVIWFNTETEQKSIAELPAQTISVLPSEKTDKSIERVEKTKPDKNNKTDKQVFSEGSVPNADKTSHINQTQSQQETGNPSYMLKKIYGLFGIFELILTGSVLLFFSGFFFYMKHRRTHKKYLKQDEAKTPRKTKKPLPDLYPFE